MTIDLDAADRNMWRKWSATLAAGPRPEAVDDGEVLLLSSGLPVALFNQAYVLGPPDDPGDLVGRVVEHYAERAAPFALYFRDAQAPGLAAACEAAGLVEHWQPPLMVLDPIPEAPPPPAGVEIATLDHGLADAFAAIMADGFELDAPAAASVFGRSLLGINGFVGCLAVADGEPVATAGCYLDVDGTAGIYWVATTSACRRRGIGAAVTWAAARCAAEAGAPSVLLQASGDGEPVYRRMGFTTPVRYRQFEGTSPPS